MKDEYITKHLMVNAWLSADRIFDQKISAQTNNDDFLIT